MVLFQRDREARKARLPDGTKLTLRQVRPRDVAALRAFVRRLSPESRYLRFHGSVTDLSEAQWKYLVSADGWDHVAIVAWMGRRVVGVARYIRLDGSPDRAEVSFVVADALQRRGLGSLLRDRLVAMALRAGIRFFRAEVMAENRGMRRLLRHSSLEILSDADGVIEVGLVPRGSAPGTLERRSA
ncbi:MAG TPA: GNAT family N-acetyltransferase [Myxococcaceae bacterium]|nr:GNAT family N-acetyltransferase [Myxococcaceae bacterium]